MMMMRTDRVDVINDERQRSCSGARSNPAHRPTEDDREAVREREAIPRGDSHSDDRWWKMNSKDEKEEKERRRRRRRRRMAQKRLRIINLTIPNKG